MGEQGQPFPGQLYARQTDDAGQYQEDDEGVRAFMAACKPTLRAKSSSAPSCRGATRQTPPPADTFI
ncbi:MAG: hypothetical protein R3D55_23260 [Chloroflexota bacterium]